MFFFFKQKTAYEMRISDWSSDVCSSDLSSCRRRHLEALYPCLSVLIRGQWASHPRRANGRVRWRSAPGRAARRPLRCLRGRSEEHTSELQSLMRISYAVFCLKKKTNNNRPTHTLQHTLPITTTLPY